MPMTPEDLNRAFSIDELERLTVEELVERLDRIRPFGRLVTLPGIGIVRDQLQNGHRHDGIERLSLYERMQYEPSQSETPEVQTAKPKRRLFIFR